MGKFGARCNCHSRASDDPRHGSSSGRCRRPVEGDRAYCDECLAECGVTEPVFYGEYPEIEIPRYLLTEGWSDTSWRNNMTASSTFSEVKGGHQVDVWVFHPIPAARGDESFKHRYVVTVSAPSPDGSPSGDSAEEFETDSESEMQAAAERLIAKYIGTHLERKLRGAG